MNKQIPPPESTSRNDRLMKLTQPQVIELKNLREEGKGINELSIKFKVNKSVIYWHTNPEFRERTREYRRKYRKGNKKYYESQKEYQRNYHKNRYNNDEEFKRKQLELVKKNKEKKNG